MQMKTVPFEQWLKTSVYKPVEDKLAQVLPPPEALPTHLHEAMRYACLGGGKRVRAMMVLAAGQACSAVETPNMTQALLSAAVAVELIHAYSLVHDDLPCMDNDVLRRGKPTVHIQFNEATALLVGDALQALAFEELTSMPIAPDLTVQAMRLLAQASGSKGMVGGQALDLFYMNQSLTHAQLQQMHCLKTGALIEASLLLGAVVCQANQVQQEALTAYAKATGLAFQMVDDILDVTQDTASLGKTAGKDAHENKPTYVSTLGLAKTKQLAAELYDSALQALSPLGDAANHLRELAAFIINRKN